MATMKIFNKMKKFNVLGESLRDDDFRILLLTHTDLDGSGCAILLHYLCEGVEVRHCSNSTMSNDILKAVTEEGGNYSWIFATDISCNPEDGRTIDGFLKIHPEINFILLDHHASSTDLNRYDWAVVEPCLIKGSQRTRFYIDIPEYVSKLSSATALLYDYLVYSGNSCILDGVGGDINKILILTHTISIWDTWEWHNIFNDDVNAKKLSTTFTEYGQDMFESEINKAFESDAIWQSFVETSEKLVEIHKRKLDAFITKAVPHFKVGTITIHDRVYYICLWYGSTYLSEVFMKMKEVHPGLDLYMINTGNTISLRTDNNTDVSVFAQQFGGGGHPGAAGFSISEDYKLECLAKLMNASIEIE